MRANRQERRLQKLREALERAIAGAPGPVGLETADLFFHDHQDLARGLGEALERAGLEEALQALARHLEEDREHWLRRLERIEAEPALRARRVELDQDYLELFAAHFRRWGAAGVQAERLAEIEAGLVLAALRGALRLWVRGQGRPVLPVLVQEALALLWPALYAHARRHS
jgi:AcrR family transcriptional regulator